MHVLLTVVVVVVVVVLLLDVVPEVDVLLIPAFILGLVIEAFAPPETVLELVPEVRF